MSTNATSTQTLMAKLRAETSVEHQSLEKTVHLLDPGFTLPLYIETLKTFHAFVAQWEDFGRRACPPNMRETFHARQRAPLLLADLEFFAASPDPNKPQLPDFADPASFLGGMYVMEGSTLGGQLIAKHLEKAFNLSEGKGYSYFRGHGPETGSMWKQFSQQLEQQADQLDKDTVVSGAKQMFTAFKHWIEYNND